MDQTKPTLVTGYVDPDLDGVACMVAYAELLNVSGTNAVSAFVGVLGDDTKYLIERFETLAPRNIENANEFERIVLVDASELSVLEDRVDPMRVVEIIDHRQGHESDKFPNAKVQIELVGAAATLVGERCRVSGHVLSRGAAILLYGAIVSNTLNLRSNNTTERDREIAAWVRGIANVPEDFVHDLFAAKSDLSGEKLIDRIEHDYAVAIWGGKKVGIAQLEVLDGKKLVQERLDELIAELRKIKRDLGTDHEFLTVLDLTEEQNIFVAEDEVMKELIERVLHVKFEGPTAVRPGYIMRKEIGPLMRDNFFQSWRGR